MWLVYVAALVVGLGVLLLQAVLGSHGGGHDGGGHDSGHDGDGDGDSGVGGLVAVVLSVRFWIFAALAFGLSGTLIHAFALASPLVTFLIAAFAGSASGVFAVLAFRAITRSSAGSTPLSSRAVGQIGRVLVPLTKGQVGQVRIELTGSSVDMMATTDGDELLRGDEVLIEQVNGGVALVSKRPDELR